MLEQESVKQQVCRRRARSTREHSSGGGRAYGLSADPTQSAPTGRELGELPLVGTGISRKKAPSSLVSAEMCTLHSSTKRSRKTNTCSRFQQSTFVPASMPRTNPNPPLGSSTSKDYSRKLMKWINCALADTGFHNRILPLGNTCKDTSRPVLHIFATATQ